VTRWRLLGVTGGQTAALAEAAGAAITVDGEVKIDSNDPALIEAVEWAAAQQGLELERIEPDGLPRDAGA
jgi:hypothetical protein